jgi:hypothetical protein
MRTIVPMKDLLTCESKKTYRQREVGRNLRDYENGHDDEILVCFLYEPGRAEERRDYYYA